RTVRPVIPLVKRTVPAARAYSVSSLPMPTPTPGLKRVPRWRTMISPPLTDCPANVLTPRRCAFESRPLRLEPSPFLCAIFLFPRFRRPPGFRLRFLARLRLRRGFRRPRRFRRSLARAPDFSGARGFRPRFARLLRRARGPARGLGAGFLRGACTCGVFGGGSRLGEGLARRRSVRRLGSVRRRPAASARAPRLLRGDLGHLDARELLAVSRAALVAALGLELEHAQ